MKICPNIGEVNKRIEIIALSCAVSLSVMPKFTLSISGVNNNFKTKFLIKVRVTETLILY